MKTVLRLILLKRNIFYELIEQLLSNWAKIINSFYVYVFISCIWKVLFLALSINVNFMSV